jgi:ubiquinone/menaquinone biosynthesis C-methylase UbiE
MNQTQGFPAPDAWPEWLLQTRFARNNLFRAKVMHVVEAMGERVLDGAQLTPGTTLLDVGAGDGLIGLKAIKRIGPSLRVIMADVSAELLRQAQARSVEQDVDGQCIFLQADAEALQGVANSSVDRVTTRAALAYVPDKARAFREFFRVLRPGGRISLGEPIFQDEALEAAALARLIHFQPTHPDIEFLRLLQRIKAAQFPTSEEAIASNPLTNFSERDLIRLAGTARFESPHLELHIDPRSGWITDWDICLDTSPHPMAKSVRAILAESFTDDERQLFERVVRPHVEAGNFVSSDVVAYLTARKPNR